MRTVSLCGKPVLRMSSTQTSKAGQQDMGKTDADKATKCWTLLRLILIPNPALLKNINRFKCRIKIYNASWSPPGSTFWVQILEWTPSIMITSTEDVTKWGTRRPCSTTDFPGILVCSTIRWVPLVFGISRKKQNRQPQEGFRERVVSDSGGRDGFQGNLRRLSQPPEGDVERDEHEGRCRTFL